MCTISAPRGDSTISCSAASAARSTRRHFRSYSEAPRSVIWATRMRRKRHCRIRRLAPLAIAIYSGRADLHDTLRQRCPGFTFETEGAAREACRVAVVDDDCDYAAPPKASAGLHPAPGRGARRAPSLSVPRAVFLENPANYLAFAIDLAEAAIHASQLEVEVGYLTQIAELMSMTDASAVSERITRTVLNLLGLARGTLFIHDPRLERYVVSFTN